MSVMALQTFDNSPMILPSGILKDSVPFVASYITSSSTSPTLLTYHLTSSVWAE